MISYFPRKYLYSLSAGFFYTGFQNFELTVTVGCELQFVLFYTISYGLDAINDSVTSHASLHKKQTLGHNRFLPSHFLRSSA